MIFTVSFVAFLVSFSRAATSDDETPFVVASQTGSDNGEFDTMVLKVQEPVPRPFIYVMAPSDKGLTNVDQPSGGYFYPKPSKMFNLPVFKTLDANVPQPAAFVEETEQVERQPRSPQRRRRPYFPSQSPFMPGFLPPNQIRPLPALYGRPMRYY